MIIMIANSGKVNRLVAVSKKMKVIMDIMQAECRQVSPDVPYVITNNGPFFTIYKAFPEGKDPNTTEPLISFQLIYAEVDAHHNAEVF